MLPVRRIRGINLRVRSIDRALPYYVGTLGLWVAGRFRREAFLQWREDGEDFVGIFESLRTGWHHLEVRLLASSPEEAVMDLRARGLLPYVREIGSAWMGRGELARLVGRRIPWAQPLSPVPLVAEVADPEGRAVELIYLPEDRVALETPGLRAVEIATAKAEAVRAFFEQLGFERRGEGLSVASGQQLRVRPMSGGAQIRILFAPADDPGQRGRSGPALREGWSDRDPDGYEWAVWGGAP